MSQLFQKNFLEAYINEKNAWIEIAFEFDYLFTLNVSGIMRFVFSALLIHTDPFFYTIRLSMPDLSLECLILSSHKNRYLIAAVSVLFFLRYFSVKLRHFVQLPC